MVRTFAWMFVGLGLTGGIAAWFAAGGGTTDYFEHHVWAFVLLLMAEFGIVVWMGLALRRMNPQLATFLFCLNAGINGILFSTLFGLYTEAQIAPAFGVAAGMFGAATLYGYTTKRDLGDFRSLLLMASTGVALAILFNLLWTSSAVYWLTTLAAVAIFLGITAYTTQGLKDFGARLAGEAESMAIFGAVLLCLAFLTMLLYVLRFFGPSGGSRP